jgi:hypothetical protein
LIRSSETVAGDAADAAEIIEAAQCGDHDRREYRNPEVSPQQIENDGESQQSNYE